MGKKKETELINRIERATENLKAIRVDFDEMKFMLINRIENIEDILMGESH